MCVCEPRPCAIWPSTYIDIIRAVSWCPQVLLLLLLLFLLLLPLCLPSPPILFTASGRRAQWDLNGGASLVEPRREALRGSRKSRWLASRARATLLHQHYRGGGEGGGVVFFSGTAPLVCHGSPVGLLRLPAVILFARCPRLQAQADPAEPEAGASSPLNEAHDTDKNAPLQRGALLGPKVDPWRRGTLRPPTSSNPISALLVLYTMYWRTITLSRASLAPWLL